MKIKLTDRTLRIYTGVIGLKEINKSFSFIYLKEQLKALRDIGSITKKEQSNLLKMISSDDNEMVLLATKIIYNKL